MRITYSLDYSNGRLWNENGESAWWCREGQAIRERIDAFVAEFGLTRPSLHRHPEAADLDTALRFIAACHALSTATIQVKAEIVCPMTFFVGRLKRYSRQELSPVTVQVVDEQGHSPGFIWRESQGWSWQDFQNKRLGSTGNKESAWNALIESLRSSKENLIILES